MTSIIIMCRQDSILSFVTCRRGSYEQNMIFRVLDGRTIGPEVVTVNDDIIVKLVSLQPHLQ
jgi:hypothetical protein